MAPRIPGRRGFLRMLLGVALAALGVKQAAAELIHEDSPAGAAATWKYRSHTALTSPHPVPRPQGLPADFALWATTRSIRPSTGCGPRIRPWAPPCRLRRGRSFRSTS